MGQQPPPALRTRLILPGRKSEMLAYSIARCTDGAGRLGSSRIGVKADAAKIASEARLQKRQRLGIERLARRTQNVMNDARGLRRLPPPDLSARELRLPSCFFVPVSQSSHNPGRFRTRTSAAAWLCHPWPHAKAAPSCWRKDEDFATARTARCLVLQEAEHS